MYKIIQSEKFHDMNARVETVQIGAVSTAKRLVSYASVVCDICLDTKAVYLYPRHRYGTTTTRQVTRFLSEMLGEQICGRDLDSVAREFKATGPVMYKGYAWFLREYVLGTENRW